MSSKINPDKKRVALVGNKMKSDEKNSCCDEDIVSEIMKSMDMKKKIVSYKDLEEFRERNQNLKPVNNEGTVMGVKQTKNYTFNKKHHPLMEKCQKNLKYLKHNRSIPKQRAHVGEISTFKNINKKLNSIEKPISTKIFNKEKQIQKKANIISKKVQKSSFLPVNIEKKPALKLPSLSKSLSNQEVRKVDEQSSIDLSDSSDSECNFENFLRVQKEDLLESSSSESSSSEIERSFKKHKRKKQISGKKRKAAFNAAKSMPAARKQKLLENSRSDSSSEDESSSKKYKRKTQELMKSSTDESSSSEVERISKKLKRKEQKLVKSNNPVFDAKTPPDKKLEECDESDYETSGSLSFNMDMTDSDSSTTILNAPLEADNNSKISECSNINSNLSLDLTKPDVVSYISKKFSCAVKVERNPILDQKVISSLKNTCKFNTVLSFDENQSNYQKDKTNLENASDPIKSNSNEDDCIIICEVPKSNSIPPFKENCIRESVIPPNHNLSYADSNSTTESPSVSDNMSSQGLKNISEQDIVIENYNDGANVSNLEFGIQILSVESLNSISNDITVDNVQNSKRGEEIVLNKNSSNLTQLSDDVTGSTENKTFDSNKDYFKFAKTYSEPQNSHLDLASTNSSNNSKYNDSQIILEDSTSDFTCVPKINECLNKIDFKLINSALKQASCSETSIESDVLCDETLNKSTVNEDFCVKDKPILPPRVLEIVQKIDFEKVLMLTKSEPNEIAKSYTCSEKNVIANSSQQSTSSPTPSTSGVLSANKINNDQEKLAPHHKLNTQPIQSSSQNLFRENTFKTIEEKYIHSPSDELDAIATENILDLDESKQNIIPLIKIYFAELNKYKKIKSAEQNVSEGLKILEESQLNKVLNLEQAVQSFLQLDPCYNIIADSLKLSKTSSSPLNNLPMYRQENVKSFNEKSEEKKASTNPEAEVCSNCGLLAKLKCLGCEKEYFCSEKCGLKFWEDGHSSMCRKTQPTVKIESEI